MDNPELQVMFTATGITWRDYLAAQVLNGLMTIWGGEILQKRTDMRNFTSLAYKLADDMLLVRKFPNA